VTRPSAPVLIIASLIVANLIVGAPVGAVTPASPGSLAAVLGRATAGETIRLQPGDYSAIDLRDRHWVPAITIDAAAARLRSVRLTSVSGLTWRGGVFDGDGVERSGFGIQKSDHIEIDGVTLRRYLRVGIGIGSTHDARIANNVFTDMGSDGIDIALSRRIVVDHNRCTGSQPTEGAHPDCIQLWSRPSEQPTADITIINNDATGDTQGFTAFNHSRPDATGKMVDDGGFDRITVENNHARVSTWHGVTVYSCRGCIVRHNRVETLPNPTNPRIRAWIKLVDSDDAVVCDNRADIGYAAGTGRCRD